LFDTKRHLVFCWYYLLAERRGDCMTPQFAPVEPFDLVIFGGTGDLAMRKLLPALLHRFNDGQMPPGSRVIAVARDHGFSSVQYRERVQQALSGTGDRAGLEGFLPLLDFHALDVHQRRRLAELCAGSAAGWRLAAGQSRVVIEKPIGRDLADLPDRPLPGQGNRAEPDGGALCQHPVRAALECGNTSTTSRSPWPKPWAWTGAAGLLRQVGAMRDMVQNHLMQLLCLIAMEPPYHFPRRRARRKAEGDPRAEAR
jgi:glucose-6-phosphate 1-dehydrogenase